MLKYKINKKAIICIEVKIPLTNTFSQQSYLRQTSAILQE